MFPAVITRYVAFIATLFLLSGCGGGAAGLVDTIAKVGTGGSGNALGIVTGFGSLIVDGMRRNDSNASYTNEADQGVAVAMPMTSVMLGQSAAFAYDASGNITSVMMSPEMVGIVSAVSASNITVLGMNITANIDPALGPVTSFVGYTSLANVQVGDRIEAHGLLKTDSQGKPYLQATLIVQKPSTSGVRLTGIVTQHNAAAGSFVIGNQTITLLSATLSPAGMSLANGELVTVWSDKAPVGNVITASNIRIKLPAQSSGNVSLSGPIASFVSNSSFKLGNVTVDASAATLAPSGASLTNDTYVVVTGGYDATTNKLTASNIAVFTASAPTSVEVHGMVANFVSSSSFTLRGVVIDASNATYTGGAASQLANGVFLEVHGTVANNVVRATSVQFVAFTPSQAPNGSIIEIGGMLSSYDAKTGAFTMNMSNGGTMDGNMGTGAVFRNGSVASLVVGQAVSIAGMFNNNSLSGVDVNILASQPSAPGTLQMSGVISNITSTSFMLNGVTIQRNGVAIQGSGGGMMGGGGGMMGGVRANVSVQLVGGQYMATAIALLNG